MAKKSKKKSSQKGILVAFAILLLGISVGCMIFVTGLKYQLNTVVGNSTSYVSGLEATFGGGDSDYAANWIGICGFLVPAVGALVYFVLYVVGFKNNMGAVLP